MFASIIASISSSSLTLEEFRRLQAEVKQEIYRRFFEDETEGYEVDLDGPLTIKRGIYD